MNTSPKPLTIKDKHLNEFLDKSGVDRNRLAELLNISPASVRRWVDEERPENPTSTAFLVLIPLLLASGIDILPEPDAALVAMQLNALRALGFTDEDLKSPKVLQTVKRSVNLMTCAEVKQSRALFNALAEAWNKIDESVAAKHQKNR